MPPGKEWLICPPPFSGCFPAARHSSDQSYQHSNQKRLLKLRPAEHLFKEHSY